MMDHDRLFKELLATFFLDFLELFLPDIAAEIDKSAELVPMDKEIFTDVTSGDRHQVDVLMRAKFRGEDAFFLVHVENQSKTQPEFPRRMFRYFARLTEKYELPVYPVVVYSHDEPTRPEPDRFVIAFSQRTVLRFEYAVVQLNRLPWRRFVRRENPIASALMAKMRMAPQDRPKVKAQCLRLLASLRLDPARATLIGGFIDSYLQLTAAEMRQYEREVERFTPKEKEGMMEIITSWHQEGIAQGKEATVRRLLRRRFGAMPDDLAARLDGLSPEQLDDLTDALLDFQSPDDVERWLTRN